MDYAIDVKHLRKEFKAYSSRTGLKGAFRDLLTRNYKIVPAVNDINFSVARGEMVGYIGENGAGKSTTIKMLTGILTPTSGEIVVNGMNPHKEREKFVRTIGVVFGQRSQLQPRAGNVWVGRKGAKRCSRANTRPGAKKRRYRVRWHHRLRSR